ncbi:Spherulation-specific family 4-domain-containing protein [Paraphoma chrysanthemicola]|uniref:Spherulation-specific family 4-domain-containing protein n=1 Tax=Paraphoma chrysanthemicola TaxID=798071 RepID=A0A8K0RAI8_9PLEO|nr:Spherulation-specific family 4-domain-containing protein [Paraphoma chrysanthemicola]
MSFPPSPPPHLELDFIRKCKSASPTKSINRTSSISARNISSPYSLAIPPRSHQRTSNRADTPTQYLAPPSAAATRPRTPYLEVPEVRPRAYTLDSKSSVETLKSRGSSYELRRNDKILALAVTFGLALALAIGIPLAAILPQKWIVPLPVGVFVPMYMDPLNGAWTRMEDAILRHHEMPFIVIVNPDHGPTNATWPSATYVAAVKRMNKYSNVRTLGYIDTAQATVSNSSVRAQIATYAGWSNVTADLGLHGIFFDSTPWKDSKDGMARAYMRNVSATVRHTKGWMTEGEGLVVHNPGRLPSKEMMAYKPDIVVAFEGAYADLPSREKLHEQLADKKRGREDHAALVHAVPRDMGRGGLRRIIEKLRKDVQCIVKYPDINFLVIVNPDSGPGAAPWWPNIDYAREIPKLTAFTNVHAVGYVRSTYCNRPIDQVFQDIDTYATRKIGGKDKLFQGIFVDETVNIFSPEVKTYLDRVDSKIKGTRGLSGKRFTIHNPGTAVNKGLANPGPDVTVVVETSYQEFVKPDYQNWLKTSPYGRSRTCYMLYGVPAEKVRSVTAALRGKAEYLFVTSATEAFYESFDSRSWDQFVDAMAAT